MSELKSQMAGAYDKTNVAEQFTKKTQSSSNGTSEGATTVQKQAKSYENWLDTKVKENSKTINSVQGSANAFKAAYKYIGQMPFLRINRSSVNVNVPWILPQEFDKYARSLDQYSEELKNLQKNWCNGKPDANCLDSKTSTNLRAFQSSIDRNLKALESYRHFPDKIQKYVTWRQKYTAWALCNINTIQQFSGKWLKENGVRFQKWAEFYILMKAIVSSWQPIVDIFRDAKAQCGVCQNQRYTLDYFKFKLLSMLIPTLPVVTFPKWPDVVLDLSDVRFAISVDVPDFTFNVSPIRLPNLPSLSLPSAPTLGFQFPTLPLLLPPLPDLPDLPELPSLPRISLPPLPPPPKLPKIFGAISVVTNLIKLYQKVKCLYQSSILIPEWQAGDVIAQRTSRQGTLPFDFLNLQFPQLSIKGLKEIRVQSHVNFELRSDFITEFVRSAVKPLNQFNTDLGRSIPSKIVPDVNIDTPGKVKVKVGMNREYLEGSGQDMTELVTTLGEYSTETLDIDQFIPFFRRELITSGQPTISLDRSLQKIRIDLEHTNREITTHQSQQSRYLNSYIEAEEAKTRELEKLIDRMRHPDLMLSENDLPIATYVGQANDLAGTRLEKYQSFLALSNPLTSLKSSTYPDEYRIQKDGISLKNRMNRLVASDGGAGITLPSERITQGYSPKLE